MADKYKPTMERFLGDVANHEMEIAMDNGVYRHLVFRGNGHGTVGKVEIATFPWSLVVTGDMGTWVFSRVSDMFCFFRNADGGINPYYWSEKIQNGSSGGRRGTDCKEYCPVTFKQNVIADLEGYEFDDYDDVTKEQVIEALNSEIYWDMSHENVIGQLEDLTVGGWNISEPWEIDSEKWCYHYIWCCRFIVWATNQYDKEKSGEVRKTKING